MKSYGKDEEIKVLGVTFNGVRDIICHALEHEPKEGVYVGEDSELYPCFDSEDRMYENRYFWNFVFAKSESELKEKMARLKDMRQLRGNYDKLTGKLHPMAYWQGDTHHYVQVTEECDCTD